MVAAGCESYFLLICWWIICCFDFYSCLLCFCSIAGAIIFFCRGMCECLTDGVSVGLADGYVDVGLYSIMALMILVLYEKRSYCI